MTEAVLIKKNENLLNCQKKYFSKTFPMKKCTFINLLKATSTFLFDFFLV